MCRWLDNITRCTRTDPSATTHMTSISRVLRPTEPTGKTNFKFSCFKTIAFHGTMTGGREIDQHSFSVRD